MANLAYRGASKKDRKCSAPFSTSRTRTEETGVWKYIDFSNLFYIFILGHVIEQAPEQLHEKPIKALSLALKEILFSTSLADLVGSK